MVDWGMPIIALLSAAVLTGFLARFSPGLRWLDTPNARSAHSRPMPSAGGLAMTIPVLLITTAWVLNSTISVAVWCMVMGSACVGLAGLIDDLRGLSISWRLTMHLLAGLWVVWWLDSTPVIVLGGLLIELPALVLVLCVISFVWLLNLFNFMDGIDGLAASETCFVTLLSLILAINAGDQYSSLIASILLAVAIGFLIWNWPPARIFMGDSGSGFLGYMLGMLALMTIANGSLSVWYWLLILGVFVVDATYTLCYRFATGQRWYHGHNTHAYQQAARRFGSHGRVTLGILAINLIWLAPLAWFANREPQAGIYLAVVGLLPLGLIARALGAGRPALSGGAGVDFESARS